MMQQLKDKCNALYSEAISLLEKGAETKDICAKLLDVASLLLEIGKLDIAKKSECDIKAKRMLDCAKRLNQNKSRKEAYKFLTGQELVCPTVQQAVTGNNAVNASPTVRTEIKAETVVTQNPAIRRPVVQPEKSEIQPSSIHTTFVWDDIPKISFDDVAGLNDVKDVVFKKVILPLNNPALYEGYVKKNGGGLLLYGPPGTGKTMVAAAIAHEIGAKFCSIGASDLVLNGIGNSEKAIVNLFKEARSFPCSVIFFDEIESICPVETHAQHAKQIRSELLRQIQGMEAYGNGNEQILFLIAATNKPWEIDPAFVRPGRFGTGVYIGLPDSEAREYMVKSKLDKIKQAGIVSVAPDINLSAIVEQTDGFNGADMTNLLDEVQENSIMRSALGGTKMITQEDFEKALSKITSSVQKEDLKKLENWKRENG